MFICLSVGLNSVSATWVDVDGAGLDAINVSNTGQVSSGPSFAIDSTDKQFFAWQDLAGVFEVMGVKWDGSALVDADGVGLESANIVSAGTNGFYPVVRYDSLNRPCIAGVMGANRNPYFLRWNGSAWVDADGTGTESAVITTLYPDNYAGDDMNLDMVLDASGYPNISWRDRQRVYFQKWNGTSWVDADGTGTANTLAFTSSFTNVWHKPALALDSSGNPYIAFSDGVVHDIYMIRWNGSAWVDAAGTPVSTSTAINVSNNVNASCVVSIDIDASNHPHLSWQDFPGVVSGILYTQWNGSAWVNADGTTPGNQIVSSAPAITSYMCLDSSGDPNISYVTNTAPGGISFVKWKSGAWVDVDGVGRESEQAYAALPGEMPGYMYMQMDSLDQPQIEWSQAAGEIYFIKWTSVVVPSPTFTQTLTSTQTFTATHTFTTTPTYTATQTVTQTITQTVTPTFTLTATNTVTATITPTFTPTPLPLQLVGHLNYPSPFNNLTETTQMVYWLSCDADVKIKVFTVSGEIVYESAALPGHAGYNSFYWDGVNKSNKKIASGVFIYRILATTTRGEKAEVFQKLAVVR